MASDAYKSILQGFLEFGQMTHNENVSQLAQYYIDQVKLEDTSADKASYLMSQLVQSSCHTRHRS